VSADEALPVAQADLPARPHPQAPHLDPLAHSRPVLPGLLGRVVGQEVRGQDAHPSGVLQTHQQVLLAVGDHHPQLNRPQTRRHHLYRRIPAHEPLHRTSPARHTNLIVWEVGTTPHLDPLTCLRPIHSVVIQWVITNASKVHERLLATILQAHKQPVTTADPRHRRPLHRPQPDQRLITRGVCGPRGSLIFCAHFLAFSTDSIARLFSYLIVPLRSSQHRSGVRVAHSRLVTKLWCGPVLQPLGLWAVAASIMNSSSGNAVWA